MSWLWGSQDNRSFNVVIYEQDYKELCAWVLKKPNIETGGDLFGLWADKHTAVIQLVLGPGERCTRTTVSFYQDIDYLRRVGSYLTENEGVCHIGEWHSHHQLGLARPSGGDENTVWNNMPTYNLKRFVIFIANIQSSKQSYNVNVGCFLFEIDDQGKHMDVLPGKFTILQKTSPLLGKPELSEKRNKGAEKDDQNKIIVIKDLKMEVEGGKRPCVTYLKPILAPNSERKRGNNNNRSQPANQNKLNDEGSHVDSKKRKMNTDVRSPDKTSGTPPNEDLENLTINDEEQEEVMEQELEMEEPKKNSQEELKHEGEREKSQGENSGNMEENDEAGPPQAEQGNREKEDELGRETTPGGKTQKQKQDEEQTTNMGTAKSDTRTEQKSESEDDVLQGSIDGKKKKLEIKIKAIKTTPQPPGAKKADLFQSGSKSPKGSLPGSDVNQLATNDEQPDEKSEEAMKQQEKKETRDKKNQEEIKYDKEHECEKGKSQGGKEEKNKAGPSKAEQDKVKKESKSQQKLVKDTKSEAEAQKKKDQKKETANKGAAQSGTKKTESKKKADQQSSPKKAGPSSSTRATKKQK